MTLPRDDPAWERESLHTEIARLVSLLEAHGIEWRLPLEPSPLPTTVSEASRLSTPEKVALFRRLFRGRTDVYPIRWESKTSGKSGYAPACANEWRTGVCEKPRIKCGDCGKRLLIPLSDSVIYDHLAGGHTVGIYPLLADDTCFFLAVDFDEADWREDALAFVQSCDELGVPASLEISRSGQGAHAWVFFAHSVPARDARRLGTAIISHTCSRTRQLKLESYDRLFPNQDTMPKGGFGNLIALPLQKKPRENGCSEFVDAALRPYPDQWAFLASTQPMAPHDIEPTILRATGNAHPLDVTFIDEEDLAAPWKRQAATPRKLSVPMPKALTVTLANLVYFEKVQLPQPLANRLIRLAAFQNPEFYKAQAMRMSVWDKSRVIGCAENYPQHIALPRGCLDAAQDLLRDNGIHCDLRDERLEGEPLDVDFVGTLRLDQEAAVAAMLHHDAGVLSAPTAFGKTVTAAAMIARRGVTTLVLVHRTELLKQWQERLQAFLGVGKGGVGKGGVGTIGSGKAKPTGKIDIAVMQSLSRQGEVNRQVENYGHVIVDECHHVGAASFDAILKRTPCEIRARPNRHTDSTRWPAADYFHAMRANPPHRRQAHGCAARSGCHAAYIPHADRFAAGGGDSGCISSPCHRPSPNGRDCSRGRGCHLWIAPDPLQLSGQDCHAEIAHERGPVAVIIEPKILVNGNLGCGSIEQRDAARARIVVRRVENTVEGRTAGGKACRNAGRQRAGACISAGRQLGRVESECLDRGIFRRQVAQCERVGHADDAHHAALYL